MTQKIKITYKNYRGEVSDRVIVPDYLWFGTSQWHTELQWFLRANDIDKKSPRDFAVFDILKFWNQEDERSHKEHQSALELLQARFDEAEKMMTCQLDEIKQLKRQLEVFHNPCQTCHGTGIQPNPGKEDNAEAKLAAQGQEPVAWRVREHEGKDWILGRGDPDRIPIYLNWEKQPLYIAPQLDRGAVIEEAAKVGKTAVESAIRALKGAKE